MIKVFEKVEDYEGFAETGMKSGDLYYVKEDKSVHFKTNNIDGTDKNYNIGVGGDLVPEGNIVITENGSDIDIKQYATASVNVPIPEGYIVPTGSTTILENGEDIDIAQYATVTVDVAGSSAPTYTWQNVTETCPISLDKKSLQLITGTTYVFKTSGERVSVYYIGSDVDSDGDVDWDDDMLYLGQLLPNTEYYFTAISENSNGLIAFSNTSVVQYAVVTPAVPQPEPQYTAVTLSAQNNKVLLGTLSTSNPAKVFEIYNPNGLSVNVGQCQKQGSVGDITADGPNVLMSSVAYDDEQSAQWKCYDHLYFTAQLGSLGTYSHPSNVSAPYIELASIKVDGALDRGYGTIYYREIPITVTNEDRFFPSE